MVEEGDPDQNLFSFKHGYFQEAAYSLLAVEVKKDLHSLIAAEYEVRLASLLTVIVCIAQQMTLTDKELEPYYSVLGTSLKL
mgnify:CR=1 FL=1